MGGNGSKKYSRVRRYEEDSSESDTEDNHRRTNGRKHHSKAHRATQQPSLLDAALHIIQCHAFKQLEAIDPSTWPLEDQMSHTIATRFGDKGEQSMRWYTPYVYNMLHHQPDWNGMNKIWAEARFDLSIVIDEKKGLSFSQDKKIKARVIDDHASAIISGYHSYLAEYVKHMTNHKHSKLEKIVGHICITGPGRLMVPTTTNFLLTDNRDIKVGPDVVAINGIPDPPPHKSKSKKKTKKKGEKTTEEPEAVETKKELPITDTTILSHLAKDIAWLEKQKVLDYTVYIDKSEGKTQVSIIHDFHIYGRGKEFKKTAGEWIPGLFSQTMTPSDYATQVRLRLGIGRE
jgi:hypothetical protein